MLFVTTNWMRAFPSVIAALSLLVPASFAAGDEDGPTLLFHEDFEDGEYEGVVGQAARGLDVDATGRVNMERGTFAFFVKFDEGPGQPNWYSQFGGVGQQLGEGHYFSVMHFELHRNDFSFSLLDAGRYAQPLRLPPVIDRWETGQWRHLAVTWDRDEGITVYEDGEQVASNWGAYRWAWNLIPRHVKAGHQTFQSVSAGYGGRIGRMLVDEVRIYAEPLTDAQVAQLAENEDPTGSPIPVTPLSERRDRDLARMGWSGSSLEALPVAQAEEPLGFHFARITDAMDAKRPQGQVFEGLSRTTWPQIYYGPVIKGRQLDIELEPDAEYDRVRAFVHRPFQGFLASGAHADPDAADVDRFWLETDQATFWHRQLPDELANEPMLTLRRRQGQLGQIDFYRTDTPEQLPDAAQRHTYQFHQAQSYPDNDLGDAYRRETPLRFQQPVRASVESVDSWQLEDPAFGGFQAFTEPPDGEARAYEGVIVRLVAEELAEPTPVRIEIKEPVHSERDWLIADAVLEPQGTGQQEFTLVLRGRPVINLPEMRMKTDDDEPEHVPAKGFGVRITAAEDITWAMGDEGTRIELIETDKQEALPVAADDQLEFWRSGYMALMEIYAYSDPRLQRPLLWLAHFALEREPHKYAFRRSSLTVEFEGHERPGRAEVPEPDNPYDAPEWAIWQRAAMEQMIKEAHWRIDNNQIATGEFGTTWNDDTITIEETWIGYALALDNDEGEIKAALHRFWDGLWDLSLDRRGTSRYYGHPTHFTEEGFGGLGLPLLVDYGDPVAVNRVMSAASRMEHWLRETDAGYKRKSNWLGPDGVWYDRPGGSGVPRQPAGHLIWYNRHPQAVDWYTGLAEEAGTDWHNEPPSGFNGFTLASLLPIERQRELATEALVEGASSSRRHPDRTGWLNLGGVTEEIREEMGREFDPDISARRLRRPPTESRWRNWRVTGDERWLVDAYRLTTQWFIHYGWPFTEAYPALDRVTVPSDAIMNSRLGMRPSGRSTAGYLVYPLHGISYERGAREVAALVTENLHNRLDVRFYAFTDDEHELDARLWRLHPGTYEVTLAAKEYDAQDGGEVLMQEEVHLQRGAPLSLTLPGRQTAKLSIRPINVSEPNFDAPDPAISIDTIDHVYNRHLVIKVYNLGTQPAEDVLVRVRDLASGEVLPMGEQRIDVIEAPLDFEPRYRTVQIDNFYTMARGVIIEVDPDGEIDELNPYNNRVVLEDAHLFGPEPIGAERRAYRLHPAPGQWQVPTPRREDHAEMPE